MRVAHHGRSIRARAAGSGRRHGGTVTFEMAVLLRPELAIDRAALEQHVCGAMSTTLPCSKTRIWSHSVSDERRWETMTIVRPLGDAQQIGGDHRLALRIERARRLVEDQMRGSWISARAIASRCLCPPDRLGEPSSI